MTNGKVFNLVKIKEETNILLERVEVLKKDFTNSLFRALFKGEYLNPL